MKEEMIQRFTSYVKVDTQSDAEKESCPSTEGQLNLARQLVEEMKSIGIQEVTMDENGYVMGTIPSNTDKDVPTIGFLAHIDTATDFTGKNVKPQLHENYQGGDITLNEDLHIVLSPQQFPNLQKYQGHTLITTDGTTLLGADNKAGIAEIMTAMHYLIEHPDIKHGKIRVAFTPDEEIGRGRTSLMLMHLALPMLTQLTADRLASCNMKASTQQVRKYPLKETTSTQEQLRTKWSALRKSGCSFITNFLLTNLRSIQKATKAFST